MNVFDSPVPDIEQQALQSNPPPGTLLLPGTVSPWLLLGGTVAALCIVSSPGRARVGQAADYSKYILPAGLLIGGYLVLSKLGLFGNDTSAQNAKTAAQVQATTSAALQQAAASGDVQRVPDAQLQAFADDIYTKALQSPVDTSGIENDMLQILTLTDLLKLKQFYGTRPFNTGGAVSWCALLSVGCTAVDLDSTLKGALDRSTLASINTYLTDQNINYQF